MARIHDAIRKVDDRRLCLYTVAAEDINTLPHAVGAKETRLVRGRHGGGVVVRHLLLVLRQAVPQIACGGGIAAVAAQSQRVARDAHVAAIVAEEGACWAVRVGVDLADLLVQIRGAGSRVDGGRVGRECRADRAGCGTGCDAATVHGENDVGCTVMVMVCANKYAI